jgi:hypothetical protein
MSLVVLARKGQSLLRQSIRRDLAISFLALDTNGAFPVILGGA